MESFKLADKAGVSPRKIVTPQAIAVFIGAAIAFPMTIWGAYTWGWANKWIGGPNQGDWSTWFTAFMSGGNVLVPANWGSWLPQFIFGTVFVGVLIILRMQFVWWPIEPVGVILGSTAVVGWFMFTALVVAWIGKTLALRIAGPKFYEKYLMPFFTGLFVVALLMLYIWTLGSGQ
jgi:hypothetical protein